MGLRLCSSNGSDLEKVRKLNCPLPGSDGAHGRLVLGKLTQLAPEGLPRITRTRSRSLSHSGGFFFQDVPWDPNKPVLLDLPYWKIL